MTNPSKLEQVARAIAKEAGYDFDVEDHTDKGHWLDLARAAISAMELPTEKMMEAASAGLLGNPDHPLAAYEVRELYTLAVRAALKEER